MKVNLICKNNASRDGYNNMTLEESASVEDAESDEILMIDCIETIEQGNIDQILSNWISKLRYGGNITIRGTDILEINRALYNKAISIGDANSLLYDNQKKCCLSNKDIVNFLKNSKLKIIKNNIENFKYTIIAERPNV